MKKKSLLLILAAAIVLLLLIGSGISLSFLFDRSSPAFDSKPLDAVALFRGIGKLNKEFMRLMNLESGENRTIRLSEAEFNALTASFLGAGSPVSMLNDPKIQKKKELLKAITLQLKNGRFLFSYTKETPDNPFGRYLNIQCGFIAGFENGKDHLAIESCRIGKYSIPSDWVQKELDKKLAQEFRNTPYEKMMREILVRVETSDNSITIEYRPVPLVNALRSYFPFLPIGKNGSRIP